jgi:hypothetical protein
MGYYRTIDGKKLDSYLIEMAEKAILEPETDVFLKKMPRSCSRL